MSFPAVTGVECGWEGVWQGGGPFTDARRLIAIWWSAPLEAQTKKKTRVTPGTSRRVSRYRTVIVISPYQIRAKIIRPFVFVSTSYSLL